MSLLKTELREQRCSHSKHVMFVNPGKLAEGDILIKDA